MTAITEERDALRNELNEKGDLEKKHATQLQQLTTNREQQLRIQEEICNKRLQEIQNQIDVLNAEISTRDNTINDLTKQLRNESFDLQSKIEKLTEQKTLNENEILQKNEIVDRLQAENNELRALIIKATESVKKAISRLSEFNTQDSFDIEGRDRILKEINTSIENINTLINGVANSPAQLANPSKESSEEYIINGVANSQAQLANPSEESSEEYIIQGVRFNKKTLIQKLSKKAKQVPKDYTGNTSKYVVALEAINTGTHPNEALLNNHITIKNGIITGGKTKRRKYNKQRGGFTYKNNAKRRPFTSKLRTTSTGSNFARGKSKKTQGINVYKVAKN